MDRYELSPEKLQLILSQVNLAIISHNKWFLKLIRSIACKLPADACDLAPDSHLTCEFGKWHYSDANIIPKSHPKFSSVELKHEAMHRFAAELILSAQKNIIVDVSTYDNFSSTLSAFQLELNEVKSEVENLLYMYDSLTGASTRMNILPTLKAQQELTKRGIQTQGCIAMMDLDYFKRVNDKYGHLAGDHVLSTVVRYVIEQTRPYDTVFRYGGEEFLIFLQHTNLDEGLDLLERIRVGIETLQIKLDENLTIQVTASFGLVTLDVDTPVEVSIKRADKAMYHAKASGRNCIRIES